MKLSCKVIEDMLPMYYDGVCSDESAALVEEHLKECPECRAYYKKYDPVEGIKMDMSISDAEDFVLLAKQMRKRRLLLWGGFLSYVSATLVALVLYWAKKNR